MKHIGDATVQFKEDIFIIATASVVGSKEAEGPLRNYFDKIIVDNTMGEETWEKAESKFVELSLTTLLDKADMKPEDIDYIIAGDLLNQSIGSTFGVKSFKRPFLGVFAACSNMGVGMGLGSMLIDGGFGTNVIASASSHFCTAEKQFRFPLALGTQRPLTTTWTVTGDGSCILSKIGNTEPVIKSITTGKIIDLGIKDANNMGAAMAPAAVDTIITHLKDLNRKPEYYDLIITGDLGYVGNSLARDLLMQEGYEIGDKLGDCGIEIFDKDTQDTHSGGSGCACSAVTFAGYLYDKLCKKELNKILFVPTGALLSTTSLQQGEAIPAIAHAVEIHCCKEV